MLAQEAISEWQRMGTGTGPLLQTLGKIFSPDLNSTAILNVSHGFRFYFYALSGHRVSPSYEAMRKQLCQTIPV